jgi:hypothetical protein
MPALSEDHSPVGTRIARAAAPPTRHVTGTAASHMAHQALLFLRGRPNMRGSAKIAAKLRQLP